MRPSTAIDLAAASATETTTPAPAASPVVVQATVTGIMFRRPDTNWTAARVEPAAPPQPPLGDGRTATPLSVAGTWPGCARGLAYTLHGKPVHTERFGWQLELDADHPPTLIQPSDREGLIRLLALESVTHLGPVRAVAVVDLFGDDTLRVLEEEPERLTEISGITPARAQQAHEAWMELKSSQVPPEVLKRLYRLGLTRWQVSKITAKFGERSVQVVTGDPYELMTIDGIGFATADGIGRRAGIGADDPRRVRAGVLHVLDQLTQDGHCAAPDDTVDALVMQEKVGPRKGLGIGVERALVARQVSRLVDAGHVTSCEVNGVAGFLALTSLRDAEEELAERLLALAAGEVSAPTADWSDLTAGLVARQADALLSARTHGVLVLTGGPGTGKTHTLRRVVEGFERERQPIMLAAPTGKAARRMEEATERQASTVHRLLFYKPGEGWGFNADNPLPSGVVIVDESSMLDVELARALLAAVVPGRHRLLLVGDVDQLPSVGPGAVLRDVIDARAVPVVRLDEVMRQAAGSRIVTGAHAVNRGERPAFGEWGDKANDLKWRAYGDDDDPQQIAQDLQRLVTRVLPGRALPDGRPVDPIRDVQVLCPMHRGALGVQALGRQIAEVLNPPVAGGPALVLPARGGAAGAGSGERVIRFNDRVIQTRNNYQLGVYNGETGIVVRVDADGCAVDFADAGKPPVVVEYSAKAARDLDLAYALTIHKSQGSEWPVVVIPVHSQHAHMWSRQLLYTGMTRARRWCVLLGTEKALALAIRKDQGVTRWTALRGLLKAGAGAAGLEG
jgi:exodeoxyribonuclease V alpha subunit